MAHPDTYLNKVVIGSQEGRLQLWNFASGKMLYDFTGLGDAAVQCIAPSPALDVVGLAMSDGCVGSFEILHYMHPFVHLTVCLPQAGSLLF